MEIIITSILSIFGINWIKMLEQTFAGNLTGDSMTAKRIVLPSNIGWVDFFCRKTSGYTFVQSIFGDFSTEMGPYTTLVTLQMDNGTGEITAFKQEEYLEFVNTYDSIDITNNDVNTILNNMLFHAIKESVH